MNNSRWYSTVEIREILHKFEIEAVPLESITRSGVPSERSKVILSLSLSLSLPPPSLSYMSLLCTWLSM